MEIDRRPLQWLQIILGLIGAIGTGTTTGFFSMAMVLGKASSPGEEPWTVAFGQYIGGMVFGAPLGAIAGLTAGLIWIYQRDSSRTWNILVWISIALGFALGIAISFYSNFHSGLGWWGTTPVAMTGATLLGILAIFFQVIFEKQT